MRNISTRSKLDDGGGWGRSYISVFIWADSRQAACTFACSGKGSTVTFSFLLVLLHHSLAVSNRSYR